MQNNTNPMFNNNKFKLGLFSINCSGGLAMTTVKESWLNSWENNLKIAPLADEAGLEYLLTLSRWMGYDGETHFHSNVLESVSWPSTLLAATRRIGVISTIHTSLHNPVILAKQLATMDHISVGHVGLNMVCGWNRQEYEALGGELFLVIKIVINMFKNGLI
ncbi:LLM class flavin-dependent oxidoreductase [Arsenophonus nasoniae]|uniref:LLM class flavin-dependent oxidoreductase n=1 Tax=Arsenophonus nasoniae TaxID=638 RepID=D2U1A5_9GAMM|nr:LLM class flavin-dependent oxidoreductase [Arsenophonus nasoniae]QBY45225.1 Pyrimidine monooxygenase RutA [Arsenophonus nasoniae]WGM01222.1 LLM class flavin-dependent oxidoreductase [Arsenophonus nasoniae]WGM05408.1 LLM class flavin-dependent oxidoreductase [Arsenophonus nasoniae]WGM10416.1 LLM class flavin-dependent oxidoreductase [Arsenophonus nasoniae]WGM15127.1 LLM class flavin-dependent oxidoreductase [Arsenophonus nasoniae]